LTKQVDWAGLIPAPHLVFLRDLQLTHQEGPYLFVHAGIRPGVRLSEQTSEDLLWIREPFLSAKGKLLGVAPGALIADEPAMVVVHGHTPKKAPVVRPNRIGIDTGAVLGGALTCAVLEDDRVGFLTS
jgi:serine/threonine protein phosphatase 1